MMTVNSWEGYLVKIVKTDTIIPSMYFQFGTYESAPNQREEIKATRDDNTRDLIRVTAQGKKSEFGFKTIKDLHLADKITLQNMIYEGEEEADHDQRKIKIKFWNDELNEYRESYFYRPNMKFTVKSISDNDIIYDELQLNFVEY